MHLLLHSQEDKNGRDKAPRLLLNEQPLTSLSLRIPSRTCAGILFRRGNLSQARMLVKRKTCVCVCARLCMCACLPVCVTLAKKVFFFYQSNYEILRNFYGRKIYFYLTCSFSSIFFFKTILLLLVIYN